MNTLDKQYQALLQDILDNGVKKEDRTGTGTLSTFGRQIRHKMSEGFPLLTTKKMPFRLIATELMWFLRGDTNIKYLVDNDCHIWDGDAYKAYQKHFIGYEDVPSKDWFIHEIKTNTEFAKKWGELGPVYGKQWRNWKFTDKFTNGQQIAYVNGKVDQITNLIRDLKTNPDSRRLMVSAWNVGELDQMTLPPCHYGFQVYTRELSAKERTALGSKGSTRLYDSIKEGNYTIIDADTEMHKVCDEIGIPKRAISLMWNQRSVDSFLGLPFNIASYGLLLEIIAAATNMVPDELIGNLGDTHLYLNHIEQAKEQIGRELTREERYDLMPSITGHSEGNIATRKKINNFEGNIPGVSYHEEWLDSFNIPKRTRKPYPLPKLVIDQFDETNHYIGDMDDISEYNIEQFKLENYQSHPAIKAPLSN